MLIKKIKTIYGPNVYHRKPVLMMTLDLQDLADVSSADIPDFIDNLLSLLAGLREHRCSPGYVGGFVERLQRGTYFAHIVEHIALELSTLAGIEVGFGKTVYAGRDGLYTVVVRFKSEEGMKFLCETAVELAQSLAQGKTDYPLEEKIAEARRIVEDHQLGPSTQSVVTAAIERKIPWRRLNSRSLIQFGYGKHRRLIQATTTIQTSFIGVEIAQDKDLTKQLLEEAGIRVPRGRVVLDEAAAVAALQSLGGPVVVKPMDAQQGRGISMNLTTVEQVQTAFQIAQKIRRKVIIEDFIKGQDYRILVVDGRMVAASQRIPAHVIGDGRHTINELVEKENLNPLRGEDHEKPMTKIKIDESALLTLTRQKCKPEDVPPEGQVIYLKDMANLSTGGSAIDKTESVHPDMRLMCERAARICGLDICGVDLVAEDIERGLEQNCGIVEVNASPGLRMHVFPSHGQPRDVGAAIIEQLYPYQANGRIPILGVSGTNGKTTVARLSGFILSDAGQCVGLTSSDGIYIGDRKVMSGDTSGPVSAQVVLNDPSVEVAVLETARGGIVKRGLGFDECDAAVLTNITEDHIGQDGIESVHDILRIKSVLTESVREGGTVVLNADDALLVEYSKKELARRSPEEIIFFSMNRRSSVLREHVARGGRAFFFDDGWIYRVGDRQETRLIRVDEIPITLGGAAHFQIANVMASVALVSGQGLSDQQICRALTRFQGTGHNGGRVNIFRKKRGYVVVDYGHNPAAFAAMAQMASQWPGKVTAIVGVPGDRDDNVVKLAAQIVGRGFDKIILRDDVNRRGRAVGEIPRLFENVISRLEPKKEYHIILDEMEAITEALNEMQEDEMIFAFYDDKSKLTRVLAEAGALPVEAIEWPKATTSSPLSAWRDKAKTWLRVGAEFTRKKNLVSTTLVKT